MMEDHEFCDSCPGCRPAMLDARTGKPIPNDDLMMVVINRIWDNETSYAQRRAFIEVTLKNAHDSHNMQLAQQVIRKFQEGWQPGE
jgi:hypothetical protein